MNIQKCIITGITIQNYCVNIKELIDVFSSTDELFFFCPKYSRTVIEYAVKLTLTDLTDYNPLAEQDLMSAIIQDIDLYQSRNPHPLLDDSDFINQIEIVAGQIDETVFHYMNEKLPMNHQCEIVKPRWLGDDLIFALRVM